MVKVIASPVHQTRHYDPYYERIYPARIEDLRIEPRKNLMKFNALNPRVEGARLCLLVQTHDMHSIQKRWCLVSHLYMENTNICRSQCCCTHNI